MHLSSVAPHLNWLVEQLAKHVLLSGPRTKNSGQEHVNAEPPGAIRQRCEHPPLFVPQGLAAADTRNSSRKSVMYFKITIFCRGNFLSEVSRHLKSTQRH